MSTEVSTPEEVNLTKFAWLSIVASFFVVGLNMAAWWYTQSVGLLSAALESTVNIVAAFIALFALRAAAKPADVQHHFGRGKAEYFSAQIEGFMILIAALIIVISAAERLLSPKPLEQLGWGLFISTVAAAINGVVAFVLLRAARAHRSPTLEADGQHLLTDVYTSVGVIVGVGLVEITHWQRLDPIVAMAVGINIVITGYQLLRQSTAKLMDKSLSDEDHQLIVQVLKEFECDEVKFHALQTRESGRHRFVSMHILVPGAWDIQRGHNLSEDIEAKIIALLPDTTVSTHVEPIEDPRSWEDEPEGQYRWS